jgi:hypothetical protein
MFSVQKQDFMGNWIEVYRAQKWDDANNFREGQKPDEKSEMRIVNI